MHRSLVAAWLAVAASCGTGRAHDGFVEATDRALEAFDAESEDVARFNRMHVDDNVRLAQATSSRSNQNSRSTARARTSRVPYMIGDSPFSSPASGLRFEGLPFSQLEHPVFGARRYNVAENNTSLPQDRLLFSYRHFHGAYDTNVLGQANAVDAERFDLGFEKTLFDEMFSAQLVVPLVRQLNSDLDLYSDSLGDNLPVTDRHGDLGNLAATFKILLTQRPEYAVSAGVAVSIPTADDARIEQNFVNPAVAFTDAPAISTSPTTNISLTSRFENETVNLVPYFAWAVRPTSQFFHQGFLQIDAPLNRSDAEVAVSGTITPDDDDVYAPETFNVAQFGDIDQQTLLRLNLAFGYWLHQGRPNDVIKGVAGIFECHYTTALDNAHPFVVPVTTFDSLDSGVSDASLAVAAGSARDQFDQVNLTGGVTLDFGRLSVTNGFTAPVSDRANRSFDFEYSVYANVRY